MVVKTCDIDIILLLETLEHEAKCTSNNGDHDIDIILLVETSKHEVKCILNTIKSQWTTLYTTSSHFNFNTNGGYFYGKRKSQWMRIRSNIGQVGVACI